MFNNLIGLGIGVIGFALIVGVGTIVLQEFGGSVAVCDSTLGFAWNRTTNTCTNTTASATPTGTSWTNINYMNTQLGTSGLAGWTPAIIAFSVGMMFFGGILVYMGKGRQY